MGGPCHVLIALNIENEIVERIRDAAGEAAQVTVLSPDARRALYGTRLDDPEKDARVQREAEEALGQTEVLYAANRLPPDLYARAPRLRWVQVTSAGVDHLLARGLVTKEVAVTNASGVHTTPIGEWVLGAMLAFAKGMPSLVRSQLRHEWQRSTPGELRGATCGVVGMGAIGAEVARLAAAFGMRVLAVRRSATAASREGDVTVLPAAELPYLLGESDYVVLAVPLTAETTRMIGAAELALMRPNAVLLNIARGDVVDEPALIAALREGRIRGAALDVFAREPLPPESPLWDMENVLVSPHQSGLNERYNERAAAIFIDNLRRFLAGEPLRNRVDPERGY